MPIVGGCRTVPFISCACCRAALRLPGRQNVEWGNRCCRTVPSPFRERVRVRMNGNGVTLSPLEPSLQDLGHQFAEQRHGGGMRFLTRGLSQADGQTSWSWQESSCGAQVAWHADAGAYRQAQPGLHRRPDAAQAVADEHHLPGIPAASRQAMARERIRHGLSNITSGSGSPETSKARISRSGCAIHASGQRPSPGP